MQNGNRFKLGLFGMNCSGSVATTAPERWNAGWPENRERRGSPTPPASSFCCRSRAGSATAERPTARARASRRCPGRPRCWPHQGHCRLRHGARAARQSGVRGEVLRDRGPCRPRALRPQCRVGLEHRRISEFGAQLLEHDDRYGYTEEWVSMVKRIWSEAEAVRLQRQAFQSEERRRQAEAVGRHAAVADERGIVARQDAPSPRATSIACSW